jgi:hypothetical protein
LHQLPAPHCASTEQIVPHAPLVGPQYGPGWVPLVQSTSLPQRPQAPLAAQYGAAAS